MVNAACELLMVLAPRVVAPSRNVIVPVAAPAEPVTVAVKVTAWPTIEGLSEETSCVVLEANPKLSAYTYRLLLAET